MDGGKGDVKVVGGHGINAAPHGAECDIPVGFSGVFALDNGLAGSIIHGRSLG